METCILKVDLQCCKSCPVTIKNKLKQIKGVESITMDTKKDMVIISGKVEPSILIAAISSIHKKKAELWSYNKDSNHPSSPQHFCHDDDQNSSTEENKEDEDGEDDVPKGSVHWPHGPNMNMYDNGYAGYYEPPPPPPPMYQAARPHYIEPPPLYVRPPLPAYGPEYGYYPPRPLGYGYYQQQQQPVGNTVFHAFSDENTSACTIM